MIKVFNGRQPKISIAFERINVHMKKDGNLKKVKNKEKHEKEEYNSYPEISNTASACECTGLMYTPPQNEEELEAYQELSDMELPGKKDSYAEDKHTSK